jgi:hypothetical protein
VRRTLHPVFVAGIALAIGAVNLLTIRIPPGANPVGYLVGFLGVPILVTVAYAIWYLRKDGTD